MSRKAEFLARADEALALADRFCDGLTRQSFLQAAAAWRLLAQTENLVCWPQDLALAHAAGEAHQRSAVGKDLDRVD